jgi:hypothetical protein
VKHDGQPVFHNDKKRPIERVQQHAYNECPRVSPHREVAEESESTDDNHVDDDHCRLAKAGRNLNGTRTEQELEMRLNGEGVDQRKAGYPIKPIAASCDPGFERSVHGAGI